MLLFDIWHIFSINISQDLINKLQTGKVSSVDTLHAFQWKAIQVNKKQNCVVQFIKDAEDEAKKCDELILKGKVTDEYIVEDMKQFWPYLNPTINTTMSFIYYRPKTSTWSSC